MITNKDLSAVELSPVKADFYQIWNELMDIAHKLSERWDPSSTNESDPGIVLLKVLTAIADKLDYNIDKNILEAFMPSAAQKESMRKLTEMLGYNMKYYQSAETSVTFVCNSKDLTSSGISIPIFTNVTNAEKDINYVTTEPVIITKEIPHKEVVCIEGQLVQCENDNDNIISLDQLDDQQRYYLPEIQIAENGIFVYNISDQIYSERWQKVDNLNVQSTKSHVYKFGYDSKEGLPYIQFPDDVAEVIEDGFVIYYLRTSGINGNIAAKVLSTFEAPVDWEDITANDFSVTNKNAAQNGCNEESIEDAYNNFKKTIGTFDTLVTCRDYMNKIYQLVDDQNINLCSNIIVSDIRDDINKAYTLCSFNEYGICYLNSSNNETTFVTGKQVTRNGDNVVVGSTDVEVQVSTPAISHFDLVLYPFKTIYGLNSKAEYKSSFKYTEDKNDEIKAQLANYKTISHSFVSPKKSEIACIKNYLRLNAKITTTAKVNLAEESVILANIRKAIYSAFNMHKLDFGEEIPYDSILDVIEGADSRIKNVSLDEPELYTSIMTADNQEYAIASTSTSTAENTWKRLYNKLAVRNILAGRVDLFKYYDDFTPTFKETKYPDGKAKPNEGSVISYEAIYPYRDPTDPTALDKRIYAIEMHCDLPIKNNKSDELRSGEVVQFRAPNFKTLTSYSTYVNYNLHLLDAIESVNTPATFQTLEGFLQRAGNDEAVSYTNITDKLSATGWTLQLGKILGVYEMIDPQGSPVDPANYYETSLRWADVPNTYENFVKISDFVRTINGNLNETQDGYHKGLYRIVSSSENNKISGRGHAMVDNDGNKYQLCHTNTNQVPILTKYFVQRWWTSTVESDHTKNGLGADASLNSIPKDSEYSLKAGEYLFINYKESSTNDDGTTAEGAVKNILYTEGCIIKPNFEMVDTASAHSNLGKTYTKKDGNGYDWTSPSEVYGTDQAISGTIDGLLSLGGNEQILIRDFSRVVFKTGTNFYLASTSRKLSDISTGEAVDFELEAGEYLYYTDLNKLDYAYFGPGTGIHIPAGFMFSARDDGADISVAEIAEKGMEVIPWSFYVPQSTAAGEPDSKFIYAQEYQYLTLTEGDKINYIEISGDDTDAVGLGFTSTVSTDGKSIVQGPKWHEVTSRNTEYTLDGTTKPLPAIEVPGYSWLVRSILRLTATPDNSQTLYHDYDYIKIFGGPVVTDEDYQIYQDYLLDGGTLVRHWLPKQFLFDVKAGEETVPGKGSGNPGDVLTGWSDRALAVLETLKPTYTATSTDADPNALTVNLNYIADCVADIAKLQVASYDENGDAVRYYNDSKIKLYKAEDVQKTTTASGGVSGSSYTIPLHNLNSYWTSLSLKDFENKSDFIALHINLPTTTTRGIVMFYYVTEYNGSSFDEGAYIMPYNDATVSSSPHQFKIINSGTVSDSNNVLNTSAWQWWPNREITTGANKDKYFLKPGLNIVWIENSLTIRLFGRNTETPDNGTIVFSDLRLVDVAKANNYGVNLTQLGYKALVVNGQATDEITRVQEVLGLIKEADPDNTFYYACPIDSSIAIDFNSNLTADDEVETLSDPKIWYDANNINNKFVISEIDADYLEKGITIARTSKLR